MLIPLITEYRKRRPRPRKPAEPPPTPPGPPILIAEVLVEEPAQQGICLWRFDTMLTVTGAPITGIQVFVEGQWKDPISAQQLLDHDTIWAAYLTEDILAGKPYRIVTAPTGIVEAPRITLPQSGTVGSP